MDRQHVASVEMFLLHLRFLLLGLLFGFLDGEEEHGYPPAVIKGPPPSAGLQKRNTSLQSTTVLVSFSALQSNP